MRSSYVQFQDAVQRLLAISTSKVCPFTDTQDSSLIMGMPGHLRSHNDEKPFQCKWPGCGKGFARQVDCKRHEQLHSNHRPFICDGCRKPFARLDALNRHCALCPTIRITFPSSDLYLTCSVRSEGGSGCAKAQVLVRDDDLAQVAGFCGSKVGGHLSVGFAS